MLYTKISAFTTKITLSQINMLQRKFQQNHKSVNMTYTHSSQIYEQLNSQMTLQHSLNNIHKKTKKIFNIWVDGGYQYHGDQEGITLS